MQILINLLEKKENVLIYSFGSEPSGMDGIFSINLQDINQSKIEKMPLDNSLYLSYVNKAMAKVMRLLLKGEVPEQIEYCSC